MRVLVLLIPILLLAGCTQLDDAKEAAAEAQEKIDAAKREAQEAKDRYERVRSATIVRTEKVHLELTPEANATRIWFVANATRAGYTIPQENLTSLPLITLGGASWSMSCDPLDCSMGALDEDVVVTWADGTPGAVTIRKAQVGCETNSPESSFCAFLTLSRVDASVQLTTAASDITA